MASPLKPTDRSASRLDYVALFLDYFIVLVILYGILALCYVLAMYCEDVPYLAGFGIPLLTSTIGFIGGMLNSTQGDIVFTFRVVYFVVLQIAVGVVIFTQNAVARFAVVILIGILGGALSCQLYINATTAAGTFGTDRWERVIFTRATFQWIARIMSRQEQDDQEAPEAEAISQSSLEHIQHSDEYESRVSANENTKLLNNDDIV